MMETFERFGFHIGIGLLNILKTLNPDTIILRNTIVESYPSIVDAIKNDCLKKRSRSLV